MDASKSPLSLDTVGRDEDGLLSLEGGGGGPLLDPPPPPETGPGPPTGGGGGGAGTPGGECNNS